MTLQQHRCTPVQTSWYSHSSTKYAEPDRDNSYMRMYTTGTTTENMLPYRLPARQVAPASQRRRIDPSQSVRTTHRLHNHMDRSFTFYSLPLTLSAILAGMLAVYAWHRRSAPGAKIFTLGMIALCTWALGYALEINATNVATKLFWAKLQYPSIVAVPLAWLLFALQWSGQTHRLTRRNLVLLTLVPLATIGLAWTNEAHGLLWRSINLVQTDGITVLDLRYGAWFWVHLAYSYTLVLIGSLVLIRQAARTPYLYRRQLGVLLLALLIPWYANAIYILDLSPIPHLDLAPFSFTISGLGIAWSLFRLRLLDVTPVARHVLIEGMRDGVVVLDVQHRIVDLNPAAGRILGRSAKQIVGQSVTEVLPEQAALVTAAEAGTERSTQVVIDAETQRRVFELAVTRLNSRRGTPIGYLLIWHDITERVRAEAAIRDSETRYRVVSEMTSDYTYAFRIHEDGRVSLDWITDAFLEITGYTIEELTAKGGWRAIIHPEDSALADQFAALISAGQPAVVNFRIVTKQGETRWLRNHGKSVWDETKQRMVQVLGASRDITARTEAATALRESEQRYRILFESTPYPMWVYDCETLAFLAVNWAAVQHYGYSEAEFLAMTIKDIRPPQDLPRLADHLAGGTPSGGEFDQWRHCKKDGAIIDVEITSHPVTFDGRSAKLILANDRTERNRNDRALRQQNEYLAALHDTTLALINRLNVTDVLSAIVARAGSLVGTQHGYIYLVEYNAELRQTELVVQTGIGSFQRYIGFRLKPGEGVAGRIYQTGQPLVIDDYDAWAGRSRNFSYGRPAVVGGVPLTSGDQVIGVIGLAYDEPGRTFGAHEIELLSRFAQLASIALDNARLYSMAQQEIAERKRAEADLEEARDHALEAAKLKSEFLAVMSHELRTPLNAIIGFTDLTLTQAEGALNAVQAQHLSRVSRNAHQLLELIGGILDMSKLDAGAMQLACEPLRLEDIVASAGASIETLVHTKALRLSVQHPPLPTLHGDAGRLHQIVLNLLSNAVKFTPHGGTITVVLEHGPADTMVAAAPPMTGSPAGEWIALSVQDTGIGIPDDEHGRIWSEFYQIDASATRQYGGTGLGLAIVQRLAQHMGGHVGLRSTPQVGSTFTVWLPAMQLVAAHLSELQRFKSAA